ncbi:MAG: formylmethanofuran dehydrogenase subunit C, partial [Methyloversatilis sp.]|nr:formylmethanofuran dehydrogenase subunit C [Methyloversatilis sp.]
MSALTFTLRSAPAQRVDVGALSPAALAGGAVSDIAAIVLHVGKRAVRADQLFEIAGDDTTDIVFRGDCSKLERIG